MSGTIKFFHPEETFVYHIEKCFCKVVYSKNQNNLILEIESTEDLDHVEEDSLQNDFPKVILNVDDFPVKVQNKNQLCNDAVSIPKGTGETENEDGEVSDVYFTNLNVNEEYDYETNNNSLTFSKENGVLKLKWKGESEDFTESTDEPIPFEINCSFVEKKIEIED